MSPPSDAMSAYHIDIHQIGSTLPVPGNGLSVTTAMTTSKSSLSPIQNTHMQPDTTGSSKMNNKTLEPVFCIKGIPFSNNRLENTKSHESFQSDTLAMIRELGVPGWTSVRIRPTHLHIHRVSGAYTNAVYFVSYAPFTPHLSPRSPPPKLLLRIYGPSVSNLLSRSQELAVLHRLSLLDIGPRVLGTFSNGRIEEYLHSTPLSKEDLREPETSRWIARRMRELHSVYPKPEAKYQVWKNIRRWLRQAKRVKKRLLSKKSCCHLTRNQLDALSEIDLNTLEKELNEYHTFMDSWELKRGGRKHTVFAHNDTQYGNILRLDTPPEDQPPHYALAVIDFEYSGYNPRGFDIANHFCEWMSDYHSTDGFPPHNIRWNAFPKDKEQIRFVKAYLAHDPRVAATTVTSPTRFTSTITNTKKSTNINGTTLRDDNNDDEMDTEESFADYHEKLDIAELMEEVRYWIPAANAMWGIWGVVQADVHCTNEKEHKEDMVYSASETETETETDNEIENDTDMESETENENENEIQDKDIEEEEDEDEDMEDDSLVADHMAALTEARLRMSPSLRPNMHRTGMSDLSLGEAMTSIVPINGKNNLENVIKVYDNDDEQLELGDGSGKVEDQSGDFDYLLYAKGKIAGFRKDWKILQSENQI